MSGFAIAANFALFYLAAALKSLPGVYTPRPSKALLIEFTR
jgi:hypothetical protein